MIKQEQPSMSTRTTLTTAIALALAASACGVQALEFSNGEWSGSLDTTVSYGVSVRAEDPEAGGGNGGSYFLCNGVAMP